MNVPCRYSKTFCKKGGSWINFYKVNIGIKDIFGAKVNSDQKQKCKGLNWLGINLLTQVIAQDQSRFENDDINPMFNGCNVDHR